MRFWIPQRPDFYRAHRMPAERNPLLFPSPGPYVIDAGIRHKVEPWARR